MDKYNLAKMGIQVEFIPEVDRKLQITANEAIMQLEESNPAKRSFRFKPMNYVKFKLTLTLIIKSWQLKGTMELFR